MYNNINTLNICCFCSIKTSTSLSSNSASEEIEISSESAPSTEKSVENQEFDATSPQETIENNSVTTHIIPFCSVTKTTPVNLSYNCGQFGSISSRTRTLNFTLNILNLNLDLIKNFCKAMDKNLIKFSISGFYNLELPMPFKCIKSTATNFVENLEVAPPSQSFDKCGINKLKKCTKRRSALSLDIVKIPTKRRNNDIILVEECKTYLGKSTIVNLASRTRSKRRAVEQETEKKSKEFPGRKKRKSFELLVQEIVKKNKLRKTEKNSCKKKLASLNNKGLGSKRKNRPVEQQKKEKTKNEKCLSVKRTKKTEKNEESNKKYSRKIATDGKLENFFRVIAPMKRKEKNFKNSKVEESNKKNFNKKAKGENNWKQTFLKTVVKESVEETKGETKSRKTFQKEKTPKIKLDLKTVKIFFI